MDRAATFTDLTRRNALRRQARLPLLNLRDELNHAVTVDAAHDFVLACDTFKADRQRLQEDVLRELRATRGDDWPQTTLGWTMVHHLTTKRFHAFLEIEHGLRAPPPDPRSVTTYGEDRD